MDDAQAAHGTAAGIRFHLPAAPLRALVTSYYLIDSPAPLSEHLHPEWGNIRFALRGEWTVQSPHGTAERTPPSSLFGPTDRTRRFGTPDGFMLGVGLTPLGWLRIVRCDADRLANDYVALGDRLGPDGDGIAARLAACADDRARCDLLDALLLDLVEDVHPDERGALAVHRALVEGTAATIEAVIAATGLSHRTLNRLCLRVFGFGPKRLLRRQRFLRTLARVRERPDLSVGEVLGDGYYDQAHFTREFHAFMGIAPGAYFKSPRVLMRRVAQERTRVVGAPVQGLHAT